MNKIRTMKKILVMLIAVVGLAGLSGTNAYALGECGMACCISGSIGSGATLAKRFGLSLMYENSEMSTIKSGSDSLSPDMAIDNNWSSGSSYKVPVTMRMRKYTIAAFRPVNEKLQLAVYVPYVINDMDMRSKSGMGMVMDMKMPRAEGLGDITLFGLYTLYTDAPVRPGSRLSLGFGLKTPTGSTEERTASGALTHAMMQPGSGSWDPVAMINYMKGYYPLVLQANLFYQLTTEGRNGYEYGDQLTIDLISRYQVSDYVAAGLDLNGIYAGKDTDHDGRYSFPATSLADNPANTGITSVLLSAVLQAKVPESRASGELKFQVPVYQNANGEQLVLDWRAIGQLAWAF